MIVASVLFASWHFTVGPKNCSVYEEFGNGGVIGNIRPLVAVAADSRVRIVLGPTKNLLVSFTP
jgi:hypothetical protein